MISLLIRIEGSKGCAWAQTRVGVLSISGWTGEGQFNSHDRSRTSSTITTAHVPIQWSAQPMYGAMTIHRRHDYRTGPLQFCSNRRGSELWTLYRNPRFRDFEMDAWCHMHANTEISIFKELGLIREINGELDQEYKLSAAKSESLAEVEYEAFIAEVGLYCFT